jgi:hypothetical protein
MNEKSIASDYVFDFKETKGMIKLLILLAITIGGYKAGFFVKDLYIDIKTHSIKWIIAALSGVLSYIYAPVVCWLNSLDLEIPASILGDIITYSLEGVVKGFWGVCAAVVSAIAVKKIGDYKKTKKK